MLAVVSGTTSGIGLAVARLLIEHGWRVLGVARRPAEIMHDRYEHAQMDLHDIGALEVRMAPRLTALLSKSNLDRVGLVNNAADPGLLGPVAQLDARRLPGVLTANVAAPVWFMGALVRLAPSAATLRIVNVSSGAAGAGFPGLAAYGASKAALRLAGMALAAELRSAADRNISILSYEPGAVDTPMQALARAQSPDVLPSHDMFVRFVAEHRLVPPEAPAREIVAWLEGDEHVPFSERRLAG